MRDAAARTARDFAPAPRRARARAVEIEQEEFETLGDRVMTFARTYPREIAVAAVLVAAGGAIAWNALALQTARHPAPFFAPGKSAEPAPLPPHRPQAEAAPLPTLPPLQSPSPLAAIPAPPLTVPSSVPAQAPSPPQSQPRTAARDSIGEIIRRDPPLPVARPQTPPARPVVITPQAQTQAQADYPQRTSSIGDLIRIGDPPIPPALVGRVEPSRLVTSGQRALAKLGYGPMKADGVLGTGTRQAIERFERDRRLPVTGEFSPRTVRELSAASGISVE